MTDVACVHPTLLTRVFFGRWGGVIHAIVIIPGLCPAIASFRAEIWTREVCPGLIYFLWINQSWEQMWDRKEATFLQSVNVWATGGAVRGCEEEVNGMYLVLSVWDLTGLNYGIWPGEVHTSSCTTQEKEGVWSHTEPASFWTVKKSTRLLTTGSKSFF